MEKLSTWQKLLLALILVLGGIWLVLSVAGPVLAFQQGESALSALLKDISVFFGIGAGGIVLLLLALSRFSEGSAQIAHPTANTAASVTGWGGLKNFAIWLIVAVLLVVLFNVFQSSERADTAGTVAPPSQEVWVTILINALPFLLMIGVWIFFIWRMQNNNKDKDKS